MKYAGNKSAVVNREPRRDDRTPTTIPGNWLITAAKVTPIVKERVGSCSPMELTSARSNVAKEAMPSSVAWMEFPARGMAAGSVAEFGDSYGFEFTLVPDTEGSTTPLRTEANKRRTNNQFSCHRAGLA